MEHDSGTATSQTLLTRLARVPVDQAAWAEFVDRYGGTIYRWCRKWGLQDADAREITQNVLVKLLHRMQTFTYDATQSFRGWLHTLTHHAWVDYLAGQRRFGEATGSRDVQEWLQTVQTRDNLVHDLDQAFDRDLFEEAARRVQLRVHPQTWQVFRLLAVEGRPGKEVAARFGLKVARVFVIRSKVQKSLQVEIARLEGRSKDGK